MKLFSHFINRLILVVFFTGITFCDQVDEMEELLLNHPDFTIQPEKLYKEDGLWNSQITDSPFTGRVEIYSNNSKLEKLMECTIVRGLKNGIFIQYYNQSEKLSGIIGLYINDKKEGGWLTTEPLEGWLNASSQEFNKTQKTTYISYRDGLRDGSVKVSDFLVGRYLNGNKTDTWLFFNDTENKELWTEKHEYNEDELLYSECREILNGNIFDMDCDEYALKYIGSNYYLVQLDPMLIKNQKKIDDAKRILIKDVNGQNVEILPSEFLTHINRYHTRKISIHKERGYAFKVDKVLRALLKKTTD